MLDAEFTGKTEFFADIDWIHVYLQAGHSYIFYPAESNRPQSFELVFPDGDPLPGAISSYRQTIFTAPTSGDYIISGSEGSTYYGGTYTLSLHEITLPASTGPTTPLTVAAGGALSFPANYYGPQWISLDVVAGHSYLVRTNYASTINIVDSHGNIIANDHDSFTPSREQNFSASDTERLYAIVDDPSSDTLTFSDFVDDHGDHPASAGTITIGATVSGEWETSSDNDWYGVSLSADSSYSVDLAVDGDPRNATFEVFGPDGTSLIKNDSLTAAMFTTSSAGTYYQRQSRRRH